MAQEREGGRGLPPASSEFQDRIPFLRETGLGIALLIGVSHHRCDFTWHSRKKGEMLGYDLTRVTT